MGVSIGIVSWLVPLAIIGAIIYLATRSRQNQGISSYQALVSYFYFIIALCVITTSVGAIILVKYLLDLAFNVRNGDSETLIIASVLAGTGLLIGALHIEGKRIVQSKVDKPTPTIRRFYLFSMLTLSSIAGLVSLPIALYEIIRYYALDRDYLYYREAPSAALAAAIVLVLLWTYYLFRVLREPRQKENNGSSISGAAPTAEG